MKHTGGCHCGKVRYEVDLKLQKALSCNCSVCIKRGSLLDFVPESKFKLLSGEENLISYQFNKHVLHHLFCNNCGIVSFVRGAVAPDGTKVVAINLRCLDNVDLSGLEVTEYDGRSV